MRLIINVTHQDFKKASELINATCGLLDSEGFEVEYIDHELESDEKLIDDSDDDDR